MQAVRSPRSASSPRNSSSATRSGRAAGNGETTSFAGAAARLRCIPRHLCRPPPQRRSPRAAPASSVHFALPGFRIHRRRPPTGSCPAARGWNRADRRLASVRAHLRLRSSALTIHRRFRDARVVAIAKLPPDRAAVRNTSVGDAPRCRVPQAARDALDVLQPQAGEDTQRMSGTSPLRPADHAFLHRARDSRSRRGRRSARAGPHAFCPRSGCRWRPGSQSSARNGRWNHSAWSSEAMATPGWW